MAINLVPIAHIAAAILAIVELGLSAYLASVYSGDKYNGYHRWVPASIAFVIFSSAWSLLVLLYVGLSPLYLASFFRKLASLALHMLTACFWFGGSIALAVQFGGPPGDCGADSYCGSVRAAITLGFFLCAFFVFLTIIDAIESLCHRENRPKIQFHARGHAEGTTAQPVVAAA